MPTPQNFNDLVTTVYDTTTRNIHIVPATPDAYANTFGGQRVAWDQYEWAASIMMNDMHLSTIPSEMGTLSRFPDTMLRRSTRHFTNFSNLIPRGLR